jgi:hypothetical protein
MGCWENEIIQVSKGERRMPVEKIDSYRQELEAKLKKWKAMIDDLATKAEKTKKESEAAIKRQVAELRNKFGTVEKTLIIGAFMPIP